MEHLIKACLQEWSTQFHCHPQSPQSLVFAPVHSIFLAKATTVLLFLIYIILKNPKKLLSNFNIIAESSTSSLYAPCGALDVEILHSIVPIPFFIDYIVLIQKDLSLNSKPWPEWFASATKILWKYGLLVESKCPTESLAALCFCHHCEEDQMSPPGCEKTNKGLFQVRC